MGRPKKICGDVIRIQLDYKRRSGEGALFALIDRDDWKLAAIKWRALRSSTGSFYAYKTVTFGRTETHRVIYLHREVMRALDDQEVDHRDGDTLDCRKQNLRLADRASNAANSRLGRKNNTTGFKGVSAHRSGRWRAYIVKGARQISLGVYDTKEEAARAYDAAASDLFGEFARLNFPNV
jgi:hypothetical protein